MNGFFIPASHSENYVYNQRTKEGDYKWDREANRIQLNKQAGLQVLNKQYNTTIDNAYSNYLIANRGIRGSQMGQGYKDAYLELAQQGLQDQLGDVNLNAASARMQLGNEANTAMSNLQEQFDTEVGNLNRTTTSLQGYYDYLKNINLKSTSPVLAERLRIAEESGTDPITSYFTEDEKALSLDHMYDRVLNASPLDYEDSEGNPALSYLDWMQMTLKDTERDRTWGDWLINQGGLGEFRKAISKGIKP